MIKVEHTKAHNIVLFETSAGERTKQVLVTEAKLVLVECKPEEALLVKPEDHWMLASFAKTSNGYPPLWLKFPSNTFFKPILISLTEKIEVGDYYITFNGYTGEIIGGIRKCENSTDYLFTYCRKILALPEHFSPEQLQMIVDGKLEDGDVCLLECENKTIRYGSCSKGEGVTMDSLVIKLNPHITIYPVEEENPNMYGLEIGKQYWFQYTGCKSDWFCGIVERFTQFGHPWVKSTDGSLHNGIISPGLYKVQHVSLNPPVGEKMYTKEDFDKFCKWLDDNWRRVKTKKGSGWCHVGDFYKQSKPVKTKDLMSKYIQSLSQPKMWEIDAHLSEDGKSYIVTKVK